MKSIVYEYKDAMFYNDTINYEQCLLINIALLMFKTMHSGRMVKIVSKLNLFVKHFLGFNTA